MCQRGMVIIRKTLGFKAHPILRSPGTFVSSWHWQVLLTESRFVLPHALYLTAVLSYRLRPMEEQLYISHELCVRAKRIRDYDFDCQVRVKMLSCAEWRSDV